MVCTMLNAMPDSTAAPSSRAQLVELLRQASEAEHSLCCQYLYAAFSLKRLREDYPELDDATAHLAMAQAQRVATAILFVARQEMEHLAIATNLRSAIGEQPWLWHGDYPDRALARVLGSPMVLERCNVATLRRFQWIERNDGVFGGKTPAVEAIYLAIKQLFATLPAAELFTGDGERQIDETDIELGVSMKILPVTTRATAATAIELVLAQGEGLSDSPLVTDTHFARFTQVLDGFGELEARLGVELSRPVVENPVTAPGTKGATVVTHPFSREVMLLFERGYRLMLVMLREFFWGFRGYSGLLEAVEALKTRKQLRAERVVVIMAENAYFPFMTMFVRPLGELLTRLPAHAPNEVARAGASFLTGKTIPRWTEVEPYAAELDELARTAKELAAHAPSGPVASELGYLHQNLTRMSRNILHVWNEGT
jgi:hypothetical protein